MILQTLIFSKHLDQHEKVLFAVHKHWIELLKPGLQAGFFGFLIPWGLYLMGFSTPFFFWMAVIWSGLIYARFIYDIVDWYSDVWLLTDHSLIVIDWQGLFKNQASRIGYEDVEGGAYEIAGFWPTVLGYGKMTLKLMSGGHYHMEHVHHPKEVELAIARFTEQYLTNREHRDSTHLKSMLSEMVARHMREKLK